MKKVLLRTISALTIVAVMLSAVSINAKPTESKPFFIGFSDGLLNGKAISDATFHKAAPLVDLKDTKLIKGGSVINQLQSVNNGFQSFSQEAAPLLLGPVLSGCSSNISVGNTTNLCGAIVNFTEPTASEAPRDTTVTFAYNSAKGIDSFSIPAGISSVTIRAQGAAGGTRTLGNIAGGRGASMQGVFTVPASRKFYYLIGQKGGSTSNTSGGAGGGGGTFVSTESTFSNLSNLLLAAGGGGGASFSNLDTAGKKDANTGLFGFAGAKPSTNYSPGDGGGATGGVVNPITSAQGVAGAKGVLGGGGGAGWTANGQDADNGSITGSGGIKPSNSVTSNASGIPVSFTNNGAGGYGGGASGFNAGGGGGGFNGGGGGSKNSANSTSGSFGGGGGSYNSGGTQVNLKGTGITDGGGLNDGFVTITWTITPIVTVTRTAGLAPGSLFPIGTTTVTYQATDDLGLSSTCSFTVTVADTQAPTITAPANVTVNVDANSCTASNVSLGTPVFSDNCPGVTVSNNAPTIFPKGTTTVTWTAKDAANNTSTATQTVTVVDNIPPVITCPPNVSVTAAGSATSAVVTYSAATATDNCGGTPTITYSIPSGSTFNIGTTQVTATATDASGNTATCTFNVIVTGGSSPAITVTGNTILIPNGDVTYTTADNTDMGSTTTGTPINKVFSINSVGTAPLIVSSIIGSGPDGAKFGINGAPTFPATIAVGNSNTFTVTFFSNTPGTYFLTITVASNDPAKPNYVYNVKATAVAPLTPGTIGSPQSICTGATPTALTSSSDASGGTGSISYQWQSSTDGVNFNNIGGATSSTYAPGSLTTTTYYRRSAFTANDAIVNSNIVAVTVNPLPTVTAGSNSPVCAGSSLTLSSTAGMTTYSWSGPNSFASSAQNPTVSSSATSAMSGTYTVLVTDANGCTNTATTTVTVNPKPTVAISPSSVSIVNGNSTTLTASGASTYTWSPSTGLSATTGATVTANPTTTTTYTVTGTDANGCTNTSTSTVTVTYVPATALNFDGSNDFVNIPASTSININGTATIEGSFRTTSTSFMQMASLNSPVDGNGIDIGLSGGGFYTNVTLGTWTNYNGTAGNYADGQWHHFAVVINGTTVTIYMDGVQRGTFSGSGSLITTGGSAGVQLGRHSNGSFYYNGDLDEVRVWNKALCLDQINNNRTCEVAAQTGLQAYYKLNAGNINYNNAGMTTASDASGNSNNGTLNNFALTGTTSNWVAGTISGNCSVFTPTVASITGAGTICVGATLQLSDATIGGTWSSSNSSVASVNTSGLVTGNAAGTATITYTSACGLSTTATVTVTAKTTPTFTQVAAICSGATLSALPTTSNDGITGTWSPALNNAATTTYTFTPSAGQCATTATMTITVNPNVTPTFTQVAAICSGTTLSALPTTSNNGITGTWSPALNNTATTTYTFTPSAGQCATTATMTITVNPNVTPTFTQVAAICSGTTLTALPTTSNNGITGTWSPALNNTTTTTYTFTPTAGQCATATTMTITVNALPNAPTGTNASACAPSGVTISASGAAGETINWYAAATGGSQIGTGNTFYTNNSGTFYAEAVSAAGCVSATRTAVTATVNPLPMITGGAAAICINGTTTFNGSATPAAVNPWVSSDPSIASVDNNGVVTGHTSGSVQIMYTTSAGCTATVGVFVSGFPGVGILPAGSTAICAGSSITLNSNSEGGLTYIWTPGGATTSSITVNTAGTYTLEGTNSFGCKATASVTVTVNALPNAPTGTSASACAPSGVTISANGAVGETINWYATPTGGTPVSVGNNFNTNVSGTFYAEAVSAAGCVSATRTAVTATINPAATITGGASKICLNGTTTLTGSGTPAVSNAWVSSDPSVASVDNAGVVTAHTTGNTTITYTNNGGCTANTNIQVTGLPGVGILPAGSTAICAGSSVTLNSNSEAGLTYVWTPGGATTSSITVNTAGTYTLEGTNSFGCKSTASVTVTVNALPNAPTGTNASVCAPFGATISASGAAGESIKWYSTATGGTPVSVGNTLNTNVSGTFYAEAVSTAGCASATRTAVTATINALPVVSISGPTCLGVSAINVTATNASQVQWFLNGSPFTVNSTINPAGTVVAGGNGAGAGLNQLNALNDIFVDAAGNVYVAEQNNHRITKWTPGATSGVVVAGGNGVGNAANQLNNPNEVIVDASGNVYVSDFLNHRVQKWAPGATSGVTVAGGHGQGTALNQTPYPDGIALDAAGNLYVLEDDLYPSLPPRVTKWAPGATSGVVVVSAGFGAGANQLMDPERIVLDAAGNIYIGDYVNHRVQKWAQGASSGVTVAGGNGDGTNPNQLHSIAGLYLDAANNLYIVDPSSPSRIQKWPSGATSGTTVLTSSGSANTATSFTSGGISFDASGSMYLGDYQYNRVMKFTSSLATSYVPTAPGTYSVTVTSAAGCTANSNSVVVNALPTVSNITGTTTICSGNTTTLTAVSGANSPVFKWYSVATGGTALFTGASFTTPSLSTTTTYYVEVTDGNTCVSATRTAVTVTVNPLPTVSGISGTTTVCSGSNTSLTASSAASSPNFTWYDAATGGNVVGGGATLNTGTLFTTTTYYVQVSSNGCTSATRTAVTVTVNPKPSPLSYTVHANCDGTTTISINNATGQVLWNTNATTNSITVSTTGTYSATQTVNGCTSPVTSVNIASIPSATPTPGITVVDNCNGTSTLTASGIVGGAGFQWSTGQTNISPITVNTGGTYTLRQFANGCPSAFASATASPKTTPTATVTADGPTTVCPGATVTLHASVAAGNTYQWQKAGVDISGATSADYIATNSGSYTVVITNNGCTSAPSNAVVVTVQDIVAPVAPTIPTINSQCGPVTVSAPVATDACAGPITGTTNDATTYSTQGDHVITWTFTDPTGNSSTAVQHVIILDVTPPVPVCPSSPIVLTATTTVNGYGASFDYSTAATATDNCGVQSIVYSPAPNTFFTVGTHPVTVTVTDVNGLTAQCTFNVIVNPGPIDAIDDDYTSTPFNGAKGGTTPVVLTNDLLNNAPFTISQVNLTLVNDGGITGLTFDATGALVIPAGTWEGDYTVVYRICEAANPTNCDQATVRIRIARGLRLVANSYCNNDVPYVHYEVIPNFTPDAALPVTLTWLNGDGSPVAAQPVLTGLGLTGDILWPGAVLDAQGQPIDWPGWYIQNGIWIQGADGFEGTRPNAYLQISVNPTETIQVSYPPATPTCNAAPTNRPPVAHNDITTTEKCNGVNISVLSNDSDFENGTLTVSVSSATSVNGGTVVVNNDGTITYTPAYGFFGSDSFSYTVTDPAGLTATATVTIDVVDHTPPVTPVLPVINRECSATVPTATTTDPCGGNVTGTTSDPLVYNAQGEYDVHWTFNDGHGNTTTAVQHVIVKDVTKPVVHCPATITVTANTTDGNGTDGAIVDYTATATDNCTTPVVTYSTTSHSFFTIGTHTVTVYANDGNGNIDSCKFDVIVNCVAPVITSTAVDQTINTTIGRCDAPATYTVTASGIPAANLSYTFTGATTGTGTGTGSGSIFNKGVTTVTVTATNSCGSVSTHFTITVEDHESPVLVNVPTNISKSNDAGVCGAAVTWPMVTATDNCPVVIVTSDHNSGEVFPIGTTTVHYTATDASGNTATGSFTVTVADTEKPTFTCPSDIIVSANAKDGNGTDGYYATYGVTDAHDNCGATTTTYDIQPGSFFPIGNTPVVVTVTDSHGNVQTCTLHVIVNCVPPVITSTPVDQTINTTLGRCDAPATYIVTASGIPAANLSYTFTGATTGGGSGTGTGSIFNKGVTTVTVTATNSCGSVSTHFTITVEDHESPVLVNVPTNISKSNDAGVCGAAVTWPMVTATDNCPVVIVTSDHNSGEVFPIGTTTVHYTATDASGNTATGSFTVTVADTEKPTFTCPSDIIVSANAKDGNGTDGYYATYGVTDAHDNCGATTTTYDIQPGSFFPIGNTPVVVTVTDSHGNVQTCTLHVIVNCVPPVITSTPVDQTINTTLGRCDAPATYIVTASGIPAANLSYTFTGATTGGGSGTGTGSIFNKGVTTVTVTATNSCGSVSTHFTITVEDHESPVLVNVPTNISKSNDAGVCGAAVTWPMVTATDNCPVVIVTSDHNSGEVFPIGTTTVHYTATDASNNTTTGSFTVTVVDNENPIITTPADITHTAEAGKCSFTFATPDNTNQSPNNTNGGSGTGPSNGPSSTLVYLGAATGTDNCGAVVITGVRDDNASLTDPFPVGVTTITWSVTDAHGHTVTGTQKVTITDDEFPTITAPAAVTVPADAGVCTTVAAHITLGTPATGDNCAVQSISNDAPAVFGSGATTVTWSVTDIHGHTSTATQIVTVVDTQKPTFTCPGDITVAGQPGLNGANVSSYTVTDAADNCGVPTVTYTINPGHFFALGTTTPVTITVTDAAGSHVECTINVTVINNPPVANPDVATTPEDTPVDGNVLTNDTDLDGNPLSVTAFHIGTNTYTAGTTATIPGVGTLVINTDGTFTFTPAPNFNGNVPVATYDITDGHGGVASSTLTITVTPVNDAPVANPDFATTPEDTAVSGNVLDNDTDVDHDVLSVTAFHIGTNTYNAGTTATIPGVGTLVINTDGTFTFTPAPNFNGNVPVATYDITDGHGGVASSTLTITVTPVNDAPVANPDVAVTPEDTAVSGNVLDNDTDVDHDVLSVTGFHIDGHDYTAGTTATIPGVGTLVINTDGTFTFTPAPNFNGNVPVATYDITDGHGGVASSTLTITVTPVNDAPVANPDFATTPEDTPVSGNVLTNDTDIDGGALSVTAFHIGTNTYTAGTTATIPGVGTLVINADGTFTFTPHQTSTVMYR